MDRPRLSQPALKVLRTFLDAYTESVRTELAGADLMKSTRLPSGTLYPILLRFERAGVLESRWEREKPENLGRPRRRFYRMTPSGVRLAQEALGELLPPMSVPLRGRA